ncbi:MULTISPECIES: hypothetical protein [Vibrio]|jgi:hypothetical protein|uniref:hypothetical protein n=1 Tax=Vibrio TaxID=662 RepID=UPI00215BC897|nr:MULTISPECIES: hypothetical protein [Vibrio]MCR9639985.1 hypothetical protein [Vibrio alginolyticus]MCR9905513.1 hypothetical protein [Vibrio alginolyticus]MDW1604597.1 hypothetical protein [Vibrio sp. Vb2977]MDW1666632.1 hypothetical protein [Vibrio sp. Vb2978]MDW1681592.1 hypothetical protein [Vibrio sp. Vb2942]
MKLIVSTVAMLMVSTGVANASEPVKVNLYAESDGFCALRADKDIFQDSVKRQDGLYEVKKGRIGVLQRYDNQEELSLTCQYFIEPEALKKQLSFCALGSTSINSCSVSVNQKTYWFDGRDYSKHAKYRSITCSFSCQVD